jgi:hypothetical protein
MTNPRRPATTDCDTPASRGSGGHHRQGPIVRAEDVVKRLQEAAGIPEGKDRDGVFGGGTARALRGRFGDLTDPQNPALQNMTPQMRQDIEFIQRTPGLGNGMFRQGQDEGRGCAANRSMPETATLPTVRLGEAFRLEALGLGRGGPDSPTIEIPRGPKYPNGNPDDLRAAPVAPAAPPAAAAPAVPTPPPARPSWSMGNPMGDMGGLG